MNTVILSEFRPTILFLGKFLLIYLLGNFLYGLFVSSFRPQPDPITDNVSRQTVAILNCAGEHVSSVLDTAKPTVHIGGEGRWIISIYEGCNGINIMIIFIAFIVAFGPIDKSISWFVPLGLSIIHVSNLLRLLLLYWVSIRLPQYLYFTHKYFFTAAIYLVVLILWWWWVKDFGLKSKR